MKHRTGPAAPMRRLTCFALAMAASLTICTIAEARGGYHHARGSVEAACGEAKGALPPVALQAARTATPPSPAQKPGWQARFASMWRGLLAGGAREAGCKAGPAAKPA
jgi:hypothetical protein